MSLREQVLATIRGGRPDRVPFTCYTGLMPEGAKSIPNLAWVQPAPVGAIRLPEVTTEAREISPGVRETVMTTPWGTLTQTAHTETGYGSSWTREHWIKTPEDYAVVAQLLRNSTVEATPDSYASALAQMGDKGVLISGVPRTPFQRLWIEYVGMENLALHLHDCPDAVEGVLEAMFEQSRQMLTIAAESGAELIWIPDNITGEMTGPPMFDRYLYPYYDMVCDICLPAGKLPCTHMDGMLSQIADCVGRTRLPVMEAFTPPPDGNLSVADARSQWPDKTLWLNFPSSVHLSSREEIVRVTEELVEQAGDGSGFLIGVTENIPDQVGSSSLEIIGEVLA